jgi:hypothetical protein
MNSTVAVIGFIISIILIYAGHVHNKPGKKVTPHRAEKVRAGTMRRVYDLMDSPEPHLFKAFLFTAPATIFLSIFLYSINDTFGGSLISVILLWLFFIPILFNIALNGIAKSLKSLCLSDKEMSALKEEIDTESGPGKFLGMQIISRTYR